MLQLNEANFHENIQNTEGVVLVDFYADWCGPCRMLSKVLEELESVTIYKIDTEESKNIATEFKVSALPSVVFFKDGKEVERLIGLRSARDLQRVINSFI
jgi:thioredoxin 1